MINHHFKTNQFWKNVKTTSLRFSIFEKLKQYRLWYSKILYRTTVAVSRVRDWQVLHRPIRCQNWWGQNSWIRRQDSQSEHDGKKRRDMEGESQRIYHRLYGSMSWEELILPNCSPNEDIIFGSRTKMCLDLLCLFCDGYWGIKVNQMHLFSFCLTPIESTHWFQENVLKSIILRIKYCLVVITFLNLPVTFFP